MLTRIIIDMGMPEARPEFHRKLSAEEKVQDLIDMIDAHGGKRERFQLRRIHGKLMQRKRTRRVQALIDMIEPVLAKYGDLDGC